MVSEQTPAGVIEETMNFHVDEEMEVHITVGVSPANRNISALRQFRVMGHYLCILSKYSAALIIAC
jgi:hypothetical protein